MGRVSIGQLIQKLKEISIHAQKIDAVVRILEKGFKTSPSRKKSRKTIKTYAKNVASPENVDLSNFVFTSQD